MVIPLYTPMHQNDNIIIKDVMATTKVNGVMLKKVYDVATLMGIIECTKFVMSMRLHTLVYAVSVGVPIIGLTYDPKVSFFVEYAGQKSHVDTSNLDKNKLINMMENIMDNHGLISSKVKIRASELKKLSSEDAKKAIELII